MCWPRSGCRSDREHSRNVHPVAGAHRRDDRQGLEILALGAARACPVYRVQQGRQVVDQLLILEARLAERDVDDPTLVHLALDTAGLDFLDGSLEIEGDGSRLGVRHEALAPENASQLAD